MIAAIHWIKGKGAVGVQKPFVTLVKSAVFRVRVYVTGYYLAV